MDNSLRLRENETVALEFRPAWRSAWFLFFGLFLGPAIIIFERDPGGAVWKWWLLSALFLGLLAHRLSLRYTLTNQRVISRPWFGRGRPESISLGQVAEVSVSQGLSGRVAGCGHLVISSRAFDEKPLTLLGQPAPEELADRLEALARAAEHR